MSNVVKNWKGVFGFPVTPLNQDLSLNLEGLRRRGFSAARIAAVKAMHKALYRDDLTLDQAREKISALGRGQAEVQPDVQMMLNFLANTSPQRGIVR